MSLFRWLMVVGAVLCAVGLVGAGWIIVRFIDVVKPPNEVADAYLIIVARVSSFLLVLGLLLLLLGAALWK